MLTSQGQIKLNSGLTRRVHKAMLGGSPRAERSGNSYPTLFSLRATCFYERGIYRHARLLGAGARNQTRDPARSGVERAALSFKKKRGRITGFADRHQPEDRRNPRAREFARS